MFRLLPWADRIQLLLPTGLTSHVPAVTFRVLPRHGWVVRTSAQDAAVPAYHLAEAGRLALAATVAAST